MTRFRTLLGGHPFIPYMRTRIPVPTFVRRNIQHQRPGVAFCDSLENVAVAELPLSEDDPPITSRLIHNDLAKPLFIYDMAVVIRFFIVALPLLSNECRQFDPKESQHDRPVSQDSCSD